MPKALHILHLEDDPDYSSLVKAILEKEGFAVEMVLVQDYPNFIAALEQDNFDIILGDYSLPNCNGIQALEAARQRNPDIPFLLVSGTINQQAAIDGLYHGVTDYVPKQWPERLGSSVRRALQEAQERAQRKRFESELLRREKYFRALTENSLDLITILSPEGVLKYNSSSVKGLLGYEPEELVGRNAMDLVHPDDRPHARQALQQALHDPKLPLVRELRLQRRDGEWSHFEIVAQNQLDNPDIAGIVLTSRDVTARNALQAQLRHAQKMEAIGQLAGGVAHDFKNLLAIICGNAEIISMNAHELGPESLDSLKQITAASKRAGDLTRQLLAFGRKQVLEPQTLDLNIVIEDLAKMLKRIIGKNIRLETIFEAQDTFVRADIGMMEQVLVNLVVNARDAMPRGGNLLIKTERARLAEPSARLHQEARPGEFLCLIVSDTGQGITTENLPRIFEPFFTTKEPGKGTGLGLSIVHGIIKQHQGWLEVSSHVAAGSTFKLFLPTVPRPQPQAASQLAQARSRGGNERILLVEDELALRLTTRRILENCGYTVWEAASGREAIQTWAQRPGQVDLLLTDIVMPDGLTGRELAKLLHQTQPSIKIIFISGYPPNTGRETTFFRRGTRFLQKPCPAEVLASTVRECLDEK